MNIMFWKRLYDSERYDIRKQKKITSGVYITSAIQLYILYIITGGPKFALNDSKLIK